MKFLFKLASRSRPKKFIEVIENIHTHLSRGCEFKILATLDVDDETMNNEGMRNRLKMYDKVFPIYGLSNNKIDAINREIEFTTSSDFDILINMSDDMAFIENSFDKIIESHINDGDCILHFPDQNQGSNCMTMSIMDRKYFERFNYIYNPEYESLECDVEAMEVGKRLGRYRYIDKVIFYHYHPSFGQAKYDEQYLKTESYEVRIRDKTTFDRRKINNFYL